MMVSADMVWGWNGHLRDLSFKIIAPDIASNHWFKLYSGNIKDGQVWRNLRVL